MEKLKRKLNLGLFVSFVFTIMVPLTGIPLHKLASALFLILTIVHTVIYRKKLGWKKYLLLGVVLVAFASGLFGMILEQYTMILKVHRALSIVLVFFLAIHIFVFHRRLGKRKDSKKI